MSGDSVLSVLQDRLRLLCVGVSMGWMLGLPGGWVSLAAAAESVSAAGGVPGECRAGHLFLTIDTGNMAGADHIAEVLRAEHVRATFFIANEPTFRGDLALDDHWQGYWRDRVAEGNSFGNHTWTHYTLNRMLKNGNVAGHTLDGKPVEVDRAGFCEELEKVGTRFQQLTGHTLMPIWRAPGGHTTPRTLAWAAACGYPHQVDWTSNGFLGDELPSERFPNQQLLDRALARLRDGDVMMMHLGIRSRHDPFAAVFRPLIAGLKERGFCFDTITR